MNNIGILSSSCDLDSNTESISKISNEATSNLFSHPVSKSKRPGEAVSPRTNNTPNFIDYHIPTGNLESNFQI